MTQFPFMFDTWVGSELVRLFTREVFDSHAELVAAIDEVCQEFADSLKGKPLTSDTTFSVSRVVRDVQVEFMQMMNKDRVRTALMNYALQVLYQIDADVRQQLWDSEQTIHQFSTHLTSLYC